MQELLNDGQTMTTEQAQALQQEQQAPTSQSADLTLAFSKYYSQEEFYEHFKSVFQYAGDRTKIESLPIKESEERGARITSDRIYEMAEKYAFLNFLIDKTTSRLAETIMMIQFLAFKSADIYNEKTNRKLGSELWTKIKKLIKKRRQEQTDNESEFLEQAGAEKQQKPAN